MGVVVNVFLAVTEISITPGTVAEFQLWIRNIRAAADGAAVVVVLLCGSLCLGRPEGDRAGIDSPVDLFGLATELQLPGDRQQVDYIPTKEQDVICQSHQRKQIVGEAQDGETQTDYFIKNEEQIEESKDPSPDRNHKEYDEAAFRIQRSIADQQ